VGSESEVRAALGAIEREVAPVLGGMPLHEPLFQLMCHGVPPVVKAAINEALAALGRFRCVMQGVHYWRVMPLSPAGGVEGFVLRCFGRHPS